MRGGGFLSARYRLADRTCRKETCCICISFGLFSLCTDLFKALKESKILNWKKGHVLHFVLDTHVLTSTSNLEMLSAVLVSLNKNLHTVKANSRDGLEALEIWQGFDSVDKFLSLLFGIHLGPCSRVNVAMTSHASWTWTWIRTKQPFFMCVVVSQTVFQSRNVFCSHFWIISPVVISELFPCVLRNTSTIMPLFSAFLVHHVLGSWAATATFNAFALVQILENCGRCSLDLHVCRIRRAGQGRVGVWITFLW